jgi:hypothetical protein
MSNERRVGQRYLACYPAGVRRTEGDPGIAWIRDLSVTGALLFADTKMTEGEPILLALHIDEDPDVAREAGARVVRVTQRPKDAGLWKYSVGVEFAPPLEKWRLQIEKLQEKLPNAPVADR